MILQPGERRPVELGIAADVTFGIDERDTAAQPGTREQRVLGPARRVGRCERRDEPRFTLQLRGDVALEVPA